MSLLLLSFVLADWDACDIDSTADGVSPLLGLLSKLVSLGPGLLGGSDSGCATPRSAMG